MALTQVFVHTSNVLTDDDDIYYIPRTQMTHGLLGKGLVLRGWPSKIEVVGVLGISREIYHLIYTSESLVFMFSAGRRNLDQLLRLLRHVERPSQRRRYWIDSGAEVEM